jgi:hypothetical protein
LVRSRRYSKRKPELVLAIRIRGRLVPSRGVTGTFAAVEFQLHTCDTWFTNILDEIQVVIDVNDPGEGNRFWLLLILDRETGGTIPFSTIIVFG